MPGRDDRLVHGRDKDGILEWESPGALGTLGVAFATEASGDELRDRTRNNYGTRTICRWSLLVSAPGPASAMSCVSSPAWCRA